MNDVRAADVSGVLDNLIAEGIRMREVEVALTNHLHETRGVVIDIFYNNCQVFGDDPSTPVLFQSASYVACLEFALRLPMKGAS